MANSEKYESVDDANVEEVLQEADNSDHSVNNPANTSAAVSGLLIEDQEELVDLDALFDALNIAAEDGVDAMSYIEDSDNGNTLVIPSDAITTTGLDEIGSNLVDPIEDRIVSDES
ncbi:hypothetical protein [Sneathiella limimaris]|uniref:hypothetical protein n=1 Tax=Sneathiella limimaris TaxID=1964213 RepID=UPI001469BC32|nr:hypothetical protein [Sneathiella limimaris]